MNACSLRLTTAIKYLRLSARGTFTRQLWFKGHGEGIKDRGPVQSQQHRSWKWKTYLNWVWIWAEALECPASRSVNTFLNFNREIVCAAVKVAACLLNNYQRQSHPEYRKYRFSKLTKWTCWNHRNKLALKGKFLRKFIKMHSKRKKVRKVTS